MSSVLEAIALVSPIIASNAVFAPRRFAKGVRAFDDNKIAEGVGNIDICAGQTLKGLRATNLALNTEMHASENIRGMGMVAESAKESGNILNCLTKAIKSAEESSKLFKGICNVVDFTARNVNPVIYTVGGLKVLGAKKEDRWETAADEAVAIGTMRLGEEAYNSLMGMPKLIRNKTTKQYETIERPTNKYIKAGTDALKDYLKTKKAVVNFAEKNAKLVKAMPKVVKGTMFAVTSILCYQAGDKFGDLLLGKKQPVLAEASV